MMKNKAKYIVVLILLLTLLLPSFFSALSPIALAATSDSEANDSWYKGIILFILSIIVNKIITPDEETPEEKGKTGDKPFIDHREEEYEVLGFYVNWITKHSDSQKAVQKYAENIDSVAPFWYTLNPDGSIEKRYEGHKYELSSLANNKKIDILPLINNNQQNNMMLVDKDIRKKAVNNIINLINEYNYSGINIDFEFLPEWTRHGYTSFIRLLSDKLPENKRLTISVFPKIDVSLELQGAYDYGALSKYVDKIVIMTYDHHWSSGPKGPIAPLNWVEQNIKYALEYIPAQKILLGIANYGYDWNENGPTRDLSANEATVLAKKQNSEIKWHTKYQTPYFNYWDENGHKHEVWFENSHSASFKLDLVKEYNLKGIAIWKLGNSSSKFWNNINQKLNK